MRGIAKSALDDFLLDASREHDWDFMLLQEYSAAAVVAEVSNAGHLVYAQVPIAGQRRSAIIVNHRVAASVCGQM